MTYSMDRVICFPSLPLTADPLSLSTALEPFRIPVPRQDPPPLPYLVANSDFNFDVQLAVDILPHGDPTARTRVTSTNFKVSRLSDALV